jgi:hypothetical protein
LLCLLRSWLINALPPPQRCAGTVDLGDFFLANGTEEKHPLRIRLPCKRTPGLEYIIEADNPIDFVEWAKAINGVMSEWDMLVSQGYGSATSAT